MQPHPKLLNLSFRLGLLAFLFCCSFFYISGVDTGFHIRTGAYIVEQHQIPTVNTFSGTLPDYPWYLMQWWPAALFYLLYSSGGITALIVFRALLATGMMALVCANARQETDRVSWWPFWAVTGGVLIARVRFFIRPFLLSAFLFALTLYLDRRFGKNKRWQWIGLPLLLAFWANTHAGVAYGFVLLGGIAASEWLESLWAKVRAGKNAGIKTRGLDRATLPSLLIRPVGILLGLAAVLLSAQLINPHGIKAIIFPLVAFNGSFWRAEIAELYPPDWANFKLFYLSLGLLVGLQILTRKDFSLRHALITTGFAALACHSQRSILEYTLVAVPHAAYMLHRLPAINGARALRWQRLLLPLVWLALTLFVIMPDKVYRFGIGLYPRYYPLEIYGFMAKSVPPQLVFNDMRYGGGMLWWLYPKFKPFVDGRGDAYPVEFWQQEYLPAVKGDPVWHDVFKRRNVTGALLAMTTERQPSKLARQLFNDPQWALVAFNDATMLFLARTETNREIISTNEFHLVWPGDPGLTNISPATVTEAKAEAARAFDRSPDSAFVRTALARASLVQGDFATAAPLYASLVAEAGASESYWRDYAYALFALDRNDELAKVLPYMLHHRLAPGYACYLEHFRALKQQDLKKADEWLNRALQFEPASAEYQAARVKLDAAGKEQLAPPKTQ